MNPRIPTEPDPQSGAFDQSRQPLRCSQKVKYLTLIQVLEAEVVEIGGMERMIMYPNIIWAMGFGSALYYHKWD